MSEEEKKAIKYLQHLRKYVAGTDEEEFVLLALNLIEKQNKELEPIHKLGIPVETLVAEWERLEDLEDDTDCLKYRIKELEKENKELKFDKILKREENDYLHKNYIPKSVIREKIKELETNLSSVKQINESIARFTTIQKLDYQVQILKELLGGSNE